VIDFATVYEHPLSRPCVLWERCDSHCCTMGRLLRPYDPGTDLVALPIPAPEYAYLRSISPSRSQWPEQPRALDIRLSDYALTLYMQPCNLGGACEAALRPLICRLYPYVPLLDDELRVSAVMNASALDLLWESRGLTDPCLMRAPEERRRYLEAMADLIGSLRANRDNHELFLWWNLAHRYLEAFRDYLAENLPAGDPPPSQDLFRLLHLCNKTQLFLARPDFRRKLDAEVDRYRRWGG
jgi:hypothetical protein